MKLIFFFVEKNQKKKSDDEHFLPGTRSENQFFLEIKTKERPKLSRDGYLTMPTLLVIFWKMEMLSMIYFMIKRDLRSLVDFLLAKLIHVFVSAGR